MGASLCVGFLGLGEAGSAIATDLVSLGVEVHAFDPRPVAAPRGVRIVAAPRELADADVILSINSASAAQSAAAAMAPYLGAEMVYADLNSASAALKRAVAGVIETTGALFADVALMATVPGNGVRTPSFASGPGAARFSEMLRPLGMPVQAIGAEPGAASTRKLLRSVWMKGIAVTAVEALGAAEAAGCHAWMWEEIASTLSNADEALLRRLVDGTMRHAARRGHEMQDVSALLRELGLVPHISQAAAEALHELARTG
ncbi:MAG TPA: DUF1932 domain-containing protein [Solirubrobacteraceae bacterium]|nr:DUF1932 domain-containing protein [Solirubrobacteraceae bacterium]